MLYEVITYNCASFIINQRQKLKIKTMNNFNIHNEVTQTINSLDNWQKIEPDMFFASRVLNKLNQSQSKIFHLNPIMKAAIIAGVLLINSISITYYILPEKNFETSDNSYNFV